MEAVMFLHSLHPLVDSNFICHAKITRADSVKGNESFKMLYAFIYEHKIFSNVNRKGWKKQLKKLN